MELRYVLRELTRNPRRSVASLAGIALGVGLFSSILFFVDGSGASMTARALAPLAVDQQRVLGAPLGGGLELREQVTTGTGLSAGQESDVHLSLTNSGAVAAHEVVVSYLPRVPLSYIPGSARQDGHPLPDAAGSSPLAQGPAQTGLNLGTVAPGQNIMVAVGVRARAALEAVALSRPQSTFACREQPLPQSANSPAAASLDALLPPLRRVPGVASVDGLALVDLDPGSLAGGSGQALGRGARLFGLDAAYARHYPAVHVVSGALGPRGATLSVEAAHDLGVALGDSIDMRLPGRAEPLRLPVAGIADLSQASTLFASRRASDLESFLYVPDSVVVDPATFRDVVLPAYRAAASASNGTLASAPLLEADLRLDRSRLRSDPAAAAQESQGVARAAMAIVPGQDYLIDNASNTLRVASDDAAVARRMFLFLGLPAAVLGAVLAAFAGGVLAAAQRREQAMLRLRGAHAGHLLRMLTLRSLLLAGTGSLLGVTAGLCSAGLVLGTAALRSAGTARLGASALVAIGVGLAVTVSALWVPGRRALRSDVGVQRRELVAPNAPPWQRRGLDVALLVVAVASEAVALASGAFAAPAGSVYSGQGVALPARLLVAPILAWAAGVLLAVRLQQALLRRLPLPGRGYGSPGGGTLRRSLRRRGWALASATTCVALISAFGTALVGFSAGYDAGKASDARYLVGGDLRVTPSPQRTRPLAAADSGRLQVAGVSSATPAMFSVENSVLAGPFAEDRQNLAAIDPAGYLAVVAPPDRFFVGTTAAAALGALRQDPQAILVEAGVADGLKLGVGDHASLVLARGTPAQRPVRARIAGLVRHLPGFPDGATVVASLAGFRGATGLDQPDVFLVRAAAHGPRALAAVAGALQAGPGGTEHLRVETTGAVLGKDQSSLTALNVRGLVRLDVTYTLAMTVTATAVFVFGLLLERRREYITMRAQGAPGRLLFGLVLGETAAVGASALLAGLPVGAGMGTLLVYVLRPLFVLPPGVIVTASSTVATAAATAAGVVGLALIGLLVLRRLSPTELLREV